MSYRTFIGYSSEDEKLAHYIYDCLGTITQIQPYKAEFHPDYGKDFKKRLQNELYESHFMVVLLTDKGMRSQWVNQEIGYAYALKRRLRPLYTGLPHVIPISESQAKLKGFITKDTIDIIFLDNFSSFELVVANVIYAIRSAIPNGLEEGVLKLRITCSECADEKNIPSEYEGLMPSNETICKTIELSPLQPILEYTCRFCKAKNLIDARTFLPYSTSSSQF